MLEGHPARVHLGQVQDVVDEHNQGIAAELNGGEVFLLFFCQFGFQHHLRKPDDGIHRGSDFMAHVAQKLLLGFHSIFGNTGSAFGFSLGFLRQHGSQLGRYFGFGQLSGNAFLVGHVAGHNHYPQHVPFVVLVHRPVEEHIGELTVFMPQREGRIGHRTFGKHFLVHLPRHLGVGEIHEEIRPK